MTAARTGAVRRIVACVALWLLAAQAGAAQDVQPAGGAEVAFEAERAALDAVWLETAEREARWCDEHALRGARHRIYAAILAFDPEHAAARRVLRYFKVSGGRWRQSPGYHAPNDRVSPALQEHEERYRAAFAAYRSRVLVLIERHRAELGPRGVERALRSLVAFDGEDATLRALLGEARLGSAWVLEETLRAVERRAAIAELARASLSSAPDTERSEPRDDERGLGLAWTGARETERVRVLGTALDSETDEVARVTHAVGDLFAGVFRVAGVPRPDFTIYLLAGEQERERLLASWPGLDEATRNALRGAGGGWLGRGDRLAQWSGDPLRRLDGAARQTLGTYLMDAFGIDGRSGWAWEGFGLYLVHSMLGTRLTWFFDARGYVPKSSTGLWMRLQDPTLDWLEEGRLLLEGEDPPAIGFLLGRDVNSLSERDFLLSYVLAAWLIEGRPADAIEVSRRIGAGEHPIQAFEGSLGLDLQQIEARLRRWLEEMRGR